MRNIATKITLFTLLAAIVVSCDLTKRVPQGKHLLDENNITVNGEKKNDEEHLAQLYQQENSNLLGYHLRLNMYNLANPNADSSYHAWLDRKPGTHRFLTSLLSEKQVNRLGKSFGVSGISSFLKKTGEPPVLIDKNYVKKSRNRLYAYYYKQGYFRAKVNYTIDTVSTNRAIVNYTVDTGKPYIVDTIAAYIATPALDTLYQKSLKETSLKKGKRYRESDFTAERERITNYYKNNGAWKFEQNYIRYVVDTLNTGHKANVDVIIDNEQVRQGDSTYTRPFKIYKISKVKIYVNNPYEPEAAIDTTNYNGFTIYTNGRLRYKPRALTDPIFITPGSTYSAFRRSYTSRYLSRLSIFSFPGIEYIEDPSDVTGESLIATIKLNPKDNFRFNMAADFNHSNIQDFGIQGSMGVTIRNIFRGAETLNISARGNMGSSRDMAIKDRAFFNILEYGADAKLTIPRVWFPLNTNKVILKEMIPSTLLSVGVGRQKNIGLDKENLSGILSYNWTPKRNHTAKLDLLNLQYVRNVNADNYFNVYQSSYNRINDIANSYPGLSDSYFNEDHNLTIDEGGINQFINDVQDGTTGVSMSQSDVDEIERLEERRGRLTENNLIWSSNFTYTKNTQENLTDNDFFIIKGKLESAGGLLNLLSPTMTENKGVAEGSRTIFDVQYSQYIKGELDYIKHWDLSHKRVLAMRAFFGLAVPYGNSNSIPFTRSYFAGGSNDNRAWQSYGLGPGSSGSKNDFNEANMKMAFSTELRYNIFGQLYGAVFGDVGNIWNIFDAETDPQYTFNGIKSLRDLAFGTGTGFRYDFNFFVLRFDLGFKTYDPGRLEGTRWFKGYNFSKSVLNVGINYPF
ncbi:POTRA domain-containing protein [Flavobacterium sp. RHBU_3]|uniref:translocation and assembly module lipoprotein TamL n=1 Tax=Flavobacterium sp. RHBU_3 TaxID=3391184 RepID=UPI003984E00C